MTPDAHPEPEPLRRARASFPGRTKHDRIFTDPPAVVSREIDYEAIDTARIRPDRLLFYLLTASSFIESGSDTYAGNLASYYADVPQAASWLERHWEAEELQHGLALRRYVSTSGRSSTGSVATHASSRNTA